MAVSAEVQTRVSGAVETLARYNKSPFITDYLKSQPPPHIPPGKFEKEDLCDLIRDVLLERHRGRRKYSLQLEPLLRYLDRLQETGRQHLYLFRLGGEALVRASRLRDPETLRSLPGVDDDVLGDGRMLFESKAHPSLVRIRLEGPDADGRARRLVVQWVETREFWAPAKSGAAREEAEADAVPEEDEEQAGPLLHAATGAGATKVQVRNLHHERAASFLVADLESGRCELRIQALRSSSRVARRQQLAVYRGLAESLLGVELEGPAVLAPAVRTAMLSHDIHIVHCTAILPDGGRFIGGNGALPPVDVRTLQAGVTLRFDWPQPAGGIGRVELDGRIDEILILRPLLPEQHRLLVEQVYRWRGENVELVPPTPEPPEPPFSAVLISALTRKAVRPAAATARIDSAILEYRQTHPLEERPTRAAPEAQAAQTATPGAARPAAHGRPPADPKSLKQFLGYIREVAENERSAYQREIRIVQHEERWAFRLMIVAACLALLIVTAGGVLLFLSKLAIGTITALLGALTGGGTALIHVYAKSLKEKRELIQGQLRDSQDTLLAIQTALSIPDPKERAAAMSAVAAMLLSRVTGTGTPAAPAT